MESNETQVAVSTFAVVETNDGQAVIGSLTNRGDTLRVDTGMRGRPIALDWADVDEITYEFDPGFAGLVE